MRWLSLGLVLAVHASQIAEHGGATGVRDKGLLESALARPQNLYGYEPSSDIASLAAAYAIGIARNHPFVDGNKRVALVALESFLELNGFTLDAPDADCVMHVLRLAAGDETDDAFISWVRSAVLALQD